MDTIHDELFAHGHVTVIEPPSATFAKPKRATAKTAKATKATKTTATKTVAAKKTAKR